MHFDFKAYDFADTGSARDAIAVVDARGVLRRDALQAAVQAWEQAALNAGAAASVPMVISGHKGNRLPGRHAGLPAAARALRARRRDQSTRTHQAHRRAGARRPATTRRPRPSNRAAPAPRCARPDSHIMFTSGSTGDPKGVQIGRESVTLFAGWIRDCLRLGAAPAFMDQMLFSFDFSLFNWVGALELGGACVLPARDHRRARRLHAVPGGHRRRGLGVRHPSCGSSCSTRTSTAPACLACASSCSAPSRSRRRWPRNCGSASRCAHHQFLRSDRSHLLDHLGRDRRAAPGRAESLPHRPRQALCRRLHRPGRDLHRRRPCHARLPEPAGPERLAHVHARRQARTAAVAASTTRSSCTAIASNWPRSTPRSRRCPACAPAPRWRCAGRTAPSSG